TWSKPETDTLTPPSVACPNSTESARTSQLAFPKWAHWGLLVRMPNISGAGNAAYFAYPPRPI
ncbi:MAG: hypothetical protein VCB25_05520, partial [Myxococcota bacterium]